MAKVRAIAGVMLAGALLSGCLGRGGKGGGAGPPAPSPSPTGLERPSPLAGGAFPGVPLPPGAVLKSSVSLGTVPIPVPVQVPGSFGKWEAKTYTVPLRPREVTRFYKEQMGKAWTVIFSAEGQEPQYSATLMFQGTEGGRAVVVVQVGPEAAEGTILAVVRGIQG